MSSLTVEFRLLQLVLNPIGDERRTIAMLHWDGQDMRFAWNRAELHSIAPYAEDDVGLVLDSIHENVRALLLTKQMRLTLTSGLRLAEAYPVSGGLAGLLTWGPVRMGQTQKATAHFDELSQLLGLAVPGIKPQRQRGDNWVKQRLEALGRSLLEEMGDSARDRLRVRCSVRGIVESRPPLSWLNGQWHHSFPLNFEYSATDSIAQKFQAAFGRIGAGVPSDHVGVIISVFPDSEDFRSGLDDVEKFAKAKLGDRLECMRAPLLRSGVMAIDAIADRVKSDVRNAALH